MAVEAHRLLLAQQGQGQKQFTNNAAAGWPWTAGDEARCAMTARPSHHQQASAAFQFQQQASCVGVGLPAAVAPAAPVAQYAAGGQMFVGDAVESGVTVEAATAKRLRAKEEEIQRMGRLNWALEERVKSMYVEAQVWRDLAQSNEAAANVLRGELQQARLCGNGAGGANEAESCCCGENDVAAGAGAGAAGAEDGETSSPGNGRRACAVCGEGAAEVLLLPCRHLCACAPCADAARACPACGCAKHGGNSGRSEVKRGGDEEDGGEQLGGATHGVRARERMPERERGKVEEGADRWGPHVSEWRRRNAGANLSFPVLISCSPHRCYAGMPAWRATSAKVARIEEQSCMQ